MTTHEKYMFRCLELARRGAGRVAPNPMVGAVLVYNDRIIGEGHHEVYGQAHAEVNCLASVKEADLSLVADSTLYVSLEPCAHYGKTPPCADRIVQEKIRKVVVGCRDPFPLVDGRGIEKLQKAGVDCEVGVLEKDCLDLNKRFRCFHEHQRPYIILKWAETADRKLAAAGNQPVAISQSPTNVLVHRWRSEEAAIAVGIGTVLADDPSLTTRLWPGKNPLRVLFDRLQRAPVTAKIFNAGAETLHLTGAAASLPQALQLMWEKGINSLLVEGGPTLHKSFLDNGTWDEIRVIRNESKTLPGGVDAATLPAVAATRVETLGADRIYYYYNG